MITTELLTRATATLHDCSAGWQKDKIQGVRRWLWECGIAGNFLLQQLLDGLVRYRGGWLGLGERNTSCSLSMSDRFSRNIVFAQLIHQAACEDEIKKLIHLREDACRRLLFPAAAPEYGENLDGCHQRAIAIDQFGSGGRCDRLSLRFVKRNDSYRAL